MSKIEFFFFGRGHEAAVSSSESQARNESWLYNYINADPG